MTGQPNEEIPRVKALRQRPVSIQDEAFLDAGKSLLTGSTTAGRDFAKAMAPICTAAITVYFVGLKFVAPAKAEFSIPDGIVIALPVAGYLLASVAFVLAFTPRLHAVSLNAVEDLAQTLERMTIRQHRWNRTGLWVFVAATAFTAAGLTVALVVWQ